MKYMLMFASDETWDQTVSPEEQRRGYEAVMKWWEEHSAAGRIVDGHQLKPSSTATTVRRKPDGKVTVTDGPFIEAKEALGGFAIVNVPDLDAALGLAKSWPGGEVVEVRPLVEARDDSGVPKE